MHEPSRCQVGVYSCPSTFLLHIECELVAIKFKTLNEIREKHWGCTKPGDGSVEEGMGMRVIVAWGQAPGCMCTAVAGKLIVVQVEGRQRFLWVP